MNDVRCPQCGGTCPPNSAFCGSCGAPLPAQQSDAPAESSSKLEVQPPAEFHASPPDPNPPPPNAFPPPPPAYAPLPGGYAPPPGGTPPPPGAFPPLVPGIKVVGDNTKWAIGLGIAGFLCCGPFSTVPGIFLAKKDMDEIAAGRAPNRDEGWAKGAFYLNIIALCLSVIGMCLFWGFAGMRHF